jgi:hypothetical protein
MSEETGEIIGRIEKRKREEEAQETEARTRRIECRRHAGRFFQATSDLKWLYFDLALKGAFKDWSDTKDTLEQLVSRTIWGSLWGSPDEIIEQAARYIYRPLFHCTAFRDFFAIRLFEVLPTHIRDPVKDRLIAAIRKLMLVVVPLLALTLYILVSWWTSAVVMLLFVARAFGWLKEVDTAQKLRIRNRFTREYINTIAATIKRGGFDEPTIIRQLEILDGKIPPLPKLVYVYGSPYLLGSDPTGIQEHTINVPDALYALLRLPRRNAESEISKLFFALGEEERDELSHQWRKFVDRLLTYDEPTR